MHPTLSLALIQARKRELSAQLERRHALDGFVVRRSATVRLRRYLFRAGAHDRQLSRRSRRLRVHLDHRTSDIALREPGR
jgi:hypothetical protein